MQTKDGLSGSGSKLVGLHSDYYSVLMGNRNSRVYDIASLIGAISDADRAGDVRVTRIVDYLRTLDIDGLRALIAALTRRVAALEAQHPHKDIVPQIIQNIVAEGGASPFIILAAADAPESWLAAAESGLDNGMGFICTGVNDEVTWQALNDSGTSFSTAPEVVLVSPGGFNMGTANGGVAMASQLNLNAFGRARTWIGHGNGAASGQQNFFQVDYLPGPSGTSVNVDAAGASLINSVINSSVWLEGFDIRIFNGPARPLVGLSVGGYGIMRNLRLIVENADAIRYGGLNIKNSSRDVTIQPWVGTLSSSFGVGMYLASNAAGRFDNFTIVIHGPAIVLGNPTSDMTLGNRGVVESVIFNNLLIGTRSEFNTYTRSTSAVFVNNVSPASLTTPTKALLSFNGVSMNEGDNFEAFLDVHPDQIIPNPIYISGLRTKKPTVTQRSLVHEILVTQWLPPDFIPSSFVSATERSFAQPFTSFTTP